MHSDHLVWEPTRFGFSVMLLDTTRIRTSKSCQRIGGGCGEGSLLPASLWLYTSVPCPLLADPRDTQLQAKSLTSHFGGNRKTICQMALPHKEWSHTACCTFHFPSSASLSVAAIWRTIFAASVKMLATTILASTIAWLNLCCIGEDVVGDNHACLNYRLTQSLLHRCRCCWRQPCLPRPSPDSIFAASSEIYNPTPPPLLCDLVFDNKVYPDIL